MSRELGIGIIGVGASPQGWGRTAHVPAVEAVDGVRLVAVAATSQESAQAAAEAVGGSLGPAPHPYCPPEALIGDPDVDVVAITSPVPTHHDLITAAVDAGKTVLTEWPATPTIAQTLRLAQYTAAAGARVAVGLQARVNPAARRAAQLISGGAIGRILSVNVLATTAGFGPRIAQGAVSLENPQVGMNLVTIQAAHAIDLVLTLAGDLLELSAQTTIQFPELTVDERAESYRRVVADHVLVQGRLAGGGALSVEVAGGRPADRTPFRLDVTGEDGELSLTGGGARGFQAGALQLSHNGQVAAPGADPLSVLPDEVVNVAALYRALRDDLGDGGARGADLGDGVRLAQLINEILTAASTGQRLKPIAVWPAPGRRP